MFVPETMHIIFILHHSLRHIANGLCCCEDSLESPELSTVSTGKVQNYKDPPGLLVVSDTV